MKTKVAGGAKEDGIVFGNTYDKYGSKNPIVRMMMSGFEKNLTTLVSAASPKTIHEIGCGEGHWVTKWTQQGLAARGCDFSTQVINIAKENASLHHQSPECFSVKSIYDVEPLDDSADLVVCCEVLEHLENPFQGLQALKSITKKHLIVSVPREPIWRILNLARGKYIGSLGNTPGHLQHWTKSGFMKFIEKDFIITQELSPFPWTMLLCKPK
jgi:2-polyprenyl-3-methyl-5-hydroxy-6-metoxy-1,4-benzoquinol methylase